MKIENLWKVEKVMSCKMINDVNEGKNEKNKQGEIIQNKLTNQIP